MIINTKKGGAAPDIEALSVTANGTYTAPEGVDGYSPITVNVGGGQGWQRPSAWGEYPLEFQQEKAKEDSQRTMEAIYLLYHHDAEKYGEIASFAGFNCTINGGFTVERGHMAGSTFTVDSTTSVATNTFYTEQFTTAMPEYIIYRIKPTVSGNTFSAFAFGHTNADLNAVPQMAIETYGRTHLGRISSIRNNLTIHIDVIAYGTINRMSAMFNECYSLTSLDCTGWDTSAVTTMYTMFGNCQSLISLDCSGWDTSAVTNMQAMFFDCHPLTSLDIGDWDVSAVTNMQNMFSGCYSLTSLDIGDWDVSAVTNMWNMFNGCSSLTSLDIGDWDVSAVTNMQNMFNGCSSLTSLDIGDWDVSAVTNMWNMFSGCYSLTSLDIGDWDVSSVTNMYSMFMSCRSLSNLDCSGWGTSAVTNIGNMFNSCVVLIILIAPIFRTSVNLSACSHLSHDSLMSVINNLATAQTTQTLTLGNTNRAKLTAEEIAIATAKGWTVA